ncbi:hypothetical protein [Chryseobacterium taihuense]|uniref:Uncharacterized protein n=1 Tax=Chryseobacterium taihuense TaxID=1141221 RepID=A0ABY0QQC8_9FLAO|nr:hypothetical protein [Chryseobacterium taihuense]SDL51973.1 hypothetical protein SAMN05216273_10223 [Chryseobacterium taihuense]
MNNRVLELLKNPKIIQSEDLSLLKEEINSSPYIQNIRALHLYGVHLFDRENYQKELSTTAAYTTDKKILYQLINGKLQQQPSIPDVNEETKAVERDNITEKIKHDYEAVSQDLIAPKPEIKHILVNGERNRILYEGEENFLNDENSETIDLESTLESGVIITQKREIPTETQNTEEKNIQRTDLDEKQSASSSYAEISENLLSEEDQTQKNQRQNTFSEPEIEAVPENLNVETVIDEDAIDSEKVSDKINDKSELSFLKIESFEPENEATEETQGKVHISESEIEPIAENLNVETVIDEKTIDSEKVSDKVNDESELSFLKIESFEPESEVNAESLPEKEDHQEEWKVILNPETIINEDKIETPKIAEQIKDDAQLSFHGTESFLPEIKIETSHSEAQTKTESPKSSVNKYEEEMRRLIEEVEKRMKTQKKANIAETLKDEDEDSGNEISFAETQDFVIDKKEEKENTTSDSQQNISENINNDEENKVVNSSWKPMSFENNVPDALLNKKNEADKISEKESEIVKLQDDKSGVEEFKTVSEAEINNKTEAEEIETITDDESESGEVPVMNVSFFGSEISSLLINQENKKTEEKEQEVIADEPSKKAAADSNVPGFINTWQNWLKIDRTEEILKEKAIIKTKVIESFIENNPKISQLKDEVNFVVKEKTDDISHLMTETLANLYIEQKLYTKAINAFQILIGKHPHRKDYFEAKIQEIKDNRGKN